MAGFATALMAQLGSTIATNTQELARPIEFPEVVSSRTSIISTTLTLSDYTYVGPGLTQKTLAYNGNMVGPTIRVKPGDTVHI